MKIIPSSHFLFLLCNFKLKKMKSFRWPFWKSDAPAMAFEVRVRWASCINLLLSRAGFLIGWRSLKLPRPISYQKVNCHAWFEWDMRFYHLIHIDICSGTKNRISKSKACGSLPHGTRDDCISNLLHYIHNFSRQAHHTFHYPTALKIWQSSTTNSFELRMQRMFVIAAMYWRWLNECIHNAVSRIACTHTREIVIFEPIIILILMTSSTSFDLP